jgi:hypothetical protein
LSDINEKVSMASMNMMTIRPAELSTPSRMPAPTTAPNIVPPVRRTARCKVIAAYGPSTTAIVISTQ